MKHDRCDYYICNDCAKLTKEDEYNRVHSMYIDKDDYQNYREIYLCDKCLNNRIQKES